LFTDVSQFNQSAWQDRPQILPLMRKHTFAVVGEQFVANESVTSVACELRCEQALRDSTFCLLESSWNFQYELLSSLRAGCIPVVRSLMQPLPFEDTLDWKRALFTFPKGRSVESLWEILGKMEKEEVLEMRRMGRIFANRLEHVNGLFIYFK
ncbi:hypothetical protein PFISCL1PPCAC_22213, partial [Pristionchus fissidentatus]